MDDVRYHSVSILTEFDITKKQLKSVRDHYCINHSIKGQNRQRLTAQTNDIIRWKGRLDYWIRNLSKKPNKKMDSKSMNILRAGFYEIIMDNKIPEYASVNTYVDLCKKTVDIQQSKLVNALLRKAIDIDAKKKPIDCSDYDWYSFPKWLWDKWINQFGNEMTLALAGSFNHALSFSIHRKESEISEEEFYSFCENENVVNEKWRDSGCFYSIVQNLSGLQPLLKSGKLAVQDRAAGIVVEILNPKPGETILDVCAAPGTKTHYIAELMQGDGDLYVSDLDNKRMSVFSSKWKNVNVSIKNAIEDDFPLADGILIDAPCSGTGVIGKKPDIRWRRSPGDITKFAKLQSDILNNISKFIKPKGRIVYSTCTLEPEENWGVVDAFLKLNSHFQIHKETNNHSGSWFDEKGAFAPFPPTSKTDGMFAVKLVNG
jgi:16S rRNA (cytosine967-C5)-methyltransferase